MSKQRLDEMVDEATVDCYHEAEQVVGLFTMIEENLRIPFETSVLGTAVTVERIELDDRDRIVAVCVRGRVRQNIPILDLPLPRPVPKGAEWIDAYRYWLVGGS